MRRSRSAAESFWREARRPDRRRNPLSETNCSRPEPAAKGLRFEHAYYDSIPAKHTLYGEDFAEARCSPDVFFLYTGFIWRKRQLAFTYSIRFHPALAAQAAERARTHFIVAAPCFRSLAFVKERSLPRREKSGNGARGRASQIEYVALQYHEQQQ